MSAISTKTRSIQTMLVALFLCVLFVLGTFYPDLFWSTHFWSFLPIPLKISGFIVITVFLVAIYFDGIKRPRYNFSLSTLVLLVISVVMGLSFYTLNIVDDYYGDAKNFAHLLPQKITTLSENFWSDLFTIKFQTGHARWGVVHLYSFFSYLFGINMQQVFRIADSLFGAGFVFVYGKAIQSYVTHKWMQLSFMIVGLTTPMLLNFCGHIESYALVLFILISWLYFFTRYFKSKKTLWLLVLIPLLIIGIRFGTVLVFLTPMLLLGILHHFGAKFPRLNHFFSFKKLLWYILLPFYGIGVVVYFFILGDYNDSRILEDGTKAIDRLFLPLFAPDAPLDTYNLISWNHITDFLQLFVFWSPALLFLVGVIVIYWKKSVLEHHLVAIFVITLGLLLAFLFAINPLMSFPMDWDLFCLPVPIALFTLLLIFEDLKPALGPFKILLFTLGLSLLCVPTFIVLFHKKMHSFRIESVGVHVFKTYYQHSDSYLLYALQMLDDNDLYKARKENLITKLKPHINHPYDIGYANLILDEGINYYSEKNFRKARNLFLKALQHNPNEALTRDFLRKTNLVLYKNGFETPKHHKASADSLIDTGIYVSRTKQLHQKALSDLNRAIYYDPTNPRISLFQMEVQFKTKNFEGALKSAKQLIQFKYPSHKEALQFGIHCALEARQYQEALALSKQFLSHWNEDAFIFSIHNDLVAHNNVDRLKYKFAQN